MLLKKILALGLVVSMATESGMTAVLPVPSRGISISGQSSWEKQALGPSTLFSPIRNRLLGDRWAARARYHLIRDLRPTQHFTPVFQSAPSPPDGYISQGDRAAAEFEELKKTSLPDVVKRYLLLLTDALYDAANSPDVSDEIKTLIRDHNVNQLQIFGFNGIVKGTDDFVLGHYDTAGDRLFVALDILEALSRELVKDYLLHEYLCPLIGHEPAIFVQQQVYPKHYPDMESQSRRPEKGALGKFLRAYIDCHMADAFVRLPGRLPDIAINLDGLGFRWTTHDASFEGRDSTYRINVQEASEGFRFHVHSPMRKPTVAFLSLEETHQLQILLREIPDPDDRVRAFTDILYSMSFPGVSSSSWIEALSPNIQILGFQLAPAVMVVASVVGNSWSTGPPLSGIISAATQLALTGEGVLEPLAGRTSLNFEILSSLGEVAELFMKNRLPVNTIRTVVNLHPANSSSTWFQRYLNTWKHLHSAAQPNAFPDVVDVVLYLVALGSLSADTFISSPMVRKDSEGGWQFDVAFLRAHHAHMEQSTVPDDIKQSWQVILARSVRPENAGEILPLLESITPEIPEHQPWKNAVQLSWVEKINGLAAMGTDLSPINQFLLRLYLFRRLESGTEVSSLRTDLLDYVIPALRLLDHVAPAQGVVEASIVGTPSSLLPFLGFSSGLSTKTSLLDTTNHAASFSIDEPGLYWLILLQELSWVQFPFEFKVRNRWAQEVHRGTDARETLVDLLRRIYALARIHGMNDELPYSEDLTKLCLEISIQAWRRTQHVNIGGPLPAVIDTLGELIFGYFLGDLAEIYEKVGLTPDLIAALETGQDNELARQANLRLEEQFLQKGLIDDFIGLITHLVQRVRRAFVAGFSPLLPLTSPELLTNPNELIDSLHKALQMPNSTVASRAAGFLGVARSPQSVIPLIQAVHSSLLEEPEVAEAALKSLSLIKGRTVRLAPPPISEINGDFVERLISFKEHEVLLTGWVADTFGLDPHDDWVIEWEKPYLWLRSPHAGEMTINYIFDHSNKHLHVTLISGREKIFELSPQVLPYMLYALNVDQLELDAFTKSKAVLSYLQQEGLVGAKRRGENIFPIDRVRLQKFLWGRGLLIADHGELGGISIQMFVMEALIAPLLLHRPLVTSLTVITGMLLKRVWDIRSPLFKNAERILRAA